MCVIAASFKGRPQPKLSTLREMFKSNPHGAGYMYARDGKVIIHKGFMDEDEYIKAIFDEHFGYDDAVVYHCRISTQAGVNPSMTHPFPWSTNLKDMKPLDLDCTLGIAHNGIIPLTSNGNKEYSDTALFITEYLTNMIHNKRDLKDESILKAISNMTNSKWAMLDRSGYIATVGNWINDGGILYSNSSYKAVAKWYK